MAGSETIEWRSADDDPPETGKMVLLHCPEREEPDCEVFAVWPGYHDGIEWLWADGSCVEDDVIEWTDMPRGSHRSKGSVAYDIPSEGTKRSGIGFGEFGK